MYDFVDHHRQHFTMSTLDSYNFDEKLNSFVENINLNEIFKLKNHIKIEERSRYLWAWPNDNILSYLKDELQNLSINRILSVGCGSGLLEWIIQQYCGE